MGRDAEGNDSCLMPGALSFFSVKNLGKIQIPAGIFGVRAKIEISRN
jgi:hypothetical protein